MINLEEIMERSNLVNDYLNTWGGYPEPADGLEAHEDRATLLQRIPKLEAEVSQIAEELEDEVARSDRAYKVMNIQRKYIEELEAKLTAQGD
jgi:hypothetical protein